MRLQLKITFQSATYRGDAALSSAPPLSLRGPEGEDDLTLRPVNHSCYEMLTVKLK